MYGGRTMPKCIAAQLSATMIAGASTKGGASLPFMTTGVPKMSGSLMLKIAGTMPARPTRRSCFDLANSRSRASASVAPDPPCQVNQQPHEYDTDGRRQQRGEATDHDVRRAAGQADAPAALREEVDHLDGKDRRRERREQACGSERGQRERVSPALEQRRFLRDEE